MFDGEQLHQLIASTTRTSAATLPLPFSPSTSLPHHHVPSSSFPGFDPIQSHFFYPLLHHHPRKVDEEKQEHHHNSDNNSLVAVSMEVSPPAAVPEQMDPPWSSEEVLALLRIRSNSENWFPEFTWDHVSRKLAGLGYERSAEKCRTKFERESRCFDNNKIDNTNGSRNTINNNYRIFSELEELCHGDDPDDHHKNIPPAGHNKPTEKPITSARDNMGQNLEEEDSENNSSTPDAMSKDDEKLEDHNKLENSKRKRKREEKKKINKKREKFEMLKGFCEQMVNKLMTQQEEMHNRLIQDMVKRDEEKVKRDEAWKKQEMDRINKELEFRAKEQEIAGERQAALIKFLSKLASNDPTNNPPTSSSSSSSLAVAQNPNIITPIVTNNAQDKRVDDHDHQVLSTPSTKALAHQTNPSSSPPTLNPNPQNAQTNIVTPEKPRHENPNTVGTAAKEDIGKRWPRDEVLALINIRCSLSNNNIGEENNNNNKEGAIKAPLWERISQRMLELGYKRSAKRCKEKWENINKYFRKTKDINKKRSLDSRTCPYFHQLSTLYNQGTLTAPENRSDMPENSFDMHVSEGEKNMVQAVSAAFDFDF